MHGCWRDVYTIQYSLYTVHCFITVRSEKVLTGLTGFTGYGALWKDDYPQKGAKFTKNDFAALRRSSSYAGCNGDIGSLIFVNES